MFGHTHSAYTHLAGRRLHDYHIEVLRIIRHPRLKGEQIVDEITGLLVDLSDRKRAAIPFTLSTHDCYLTDPGKLVAILDALQKRLDGGGSPVELVYLNER